MNYSRTIRSKIKGAYLIIALVALLSLVFAPSLTGCDDAESTSENNGGQTLNDMELSGTITIGGSTSVYPLANAMAEEFKKIHPKVKIEIEVTGSSTGVSDCAKGLVDIGAASRDVKMSEADLIPYAIARDAVAIAVNPENSVTELTLEQVMQIYAGEITNWSEVGGPDAPIEVITREDGSGTRDCFESKVMNPFSADITTDAITEKKNSDVKLKVETIGAAIGFLSLGYIDDNIRAIVLDGVEPTIENCLSGDYPVLRRLNLLTKQAPDNEVKAYIDFCRSMDGQALAEKEGFIPLKLSQ